MDETVEEFTLPSTGSRNTANIHPKTSPESRAALLAEAPSQPIDTSYQPYIHPAPSGPYSRTSANFAPALSPQPLSYNPQDPQPPGGFHDREGLTTAYTGPKNRRKMKFYIPTSAWTWTFMLTTIFQAIIALGLESYVFARFQLDLRNLHENANSDKQTETRSIPTYLSLLIFGLVYQLWLVYDALRLKNTIQIIGICLYNLGIMVYTSIQLDQIRDAVEVLSGRDQIDMTYWNQVKNILIAVPVVIALGTALMSFVAWKLYGEFAWTIYKQISADLRLKRNYLIFQIYIALLKFDFFFFLGFTIQFIVVVNNTTDVEFILTIIAIPITIIILCMAAYWVKRENIVGMIIIIALWHVFLAYFLFKLIRMYSTDPRRMEDYRPARRTLTSFAVITIILLIVTITIAIWCTRNFNTGLKPHIVSGRKKRGDSNEPAQEWQDDRYEGYASYGEPGKAAPGYRPSDVPLSNHPGGSRFQID
ncbi:hypothetical protein P152DRAFT_475438 [Eremomyces bilateralis CBS 781.70]|uniref:Uncharacterized protein n=1 Tax=Eremomyces bilateralis CBS 781.70 TaxID=1392243 RepID=A0A6G1FY52_9PEZI|nr:uncharacterized protein P152DRAFT_475438 [Eremomyces bilateralis CBS 781.70]KAF1810606.1 hypothetical protein P152DRAFT_475438 [Eremomyces bilateralis CBS 781.70]